MFSDQFRRGEADKSKLAGVKGSKLISGLSDVAWKAFQSVNQRLPEGEAIRPNWAPGPLLKSYERSAPPLGFPRETDSLCPTCVKEVRNAVISGETTLETLMHEHPGEIKAQIVEEDGQVMMRKTCPKHGEFDDVMATDPAFLERIESLFFGRDFRAAEDNNVHRARNFEHQVWARRSADCRSDEPLQHDVQSVLHGCKPGWLCSRADVRRHQSDS